MSDSDFNPRALVTCGDLSYVAAEIIKEIRKASEGRADNDLLEEDLSDYAAKVHGMSHEIERLQSALREAEESNRDLRSDLFDARRELQEIERLRAALLEAEESNRGLRSDLFDARRELQERERSVERMLESRINTILRDGARQVTLLPLRNHARFIPIIKAVRVACGLGLKEAKELVDQARCFENRPLHTPKPVVLLECAPLPLASKLAAEITGAGGEVMVEKLVPERTHRNHLVDRDRCEKCGCFLPASGNCNSDKCKG